MTVEIKEITITGEVSNNTNNTFTIIQSKPKATDVFNHKFDIESFLFFGIISRI